MGLVVEVRRTRGRVVLGVLVVLVLVALLPVVRLAEDAGQQRWTTACLARGGAVQTVPSEHSNPLLVQSADPVYRCRAVDGRLISTRR